MKVAMLLVLGACAGAPEVAIDPALAVDISLLSCAPDVNACKPAEYPIERYDSEKQLDIRLVGAWRTCGVAADRGPYDRNIFGAGVELTPSREMFVLVAAADLVPAFSVSASAMADRFSGYLFQRLRP